MQSQSFVETLAENSGEYRVLDNDNVYSGEIRIGCTARQASRSGRLTGGI